MLTPAIRSNVRNRGDAVRWKYKAFLRKFAGGEMGPRFCGDDKSGGFNEHLGIVRGSARP